MMYQFDREAFKQRRARLGYVEAKPIINQVALPPKTRPVVKIASPVIDHPQFIIKRVVPINKTPDELINAVSVKKYRTPISTIVRAVSNVIKIDEKSIIYRDKRYDIVLARYFIFWLCRRAGYSYPEIGRRMDGRDHTTILHGVRQFEKHLAEDGQYAAAARRLYSELITARPAPYWGA